MPAFDPLVTESDRQKRQLLQGKRSEIYSEKDFRKAQAKQVAVPVEADLVKQSIAEAKKALPGASRTEIIAHAKNLYKDLEVNYSRKAGAEKTAEKEAVEQGAGLRAEDIRDDTGGLPSKKEGLLGRVVTGLGRPARGAVGTVSGALTELKNITKDVPITTGTFHEPTLDVQLPGVDTTDLLLGGVPVAGPALIAGRHLLTHPEKPADINFSVAPSDVVKAVMPPAGDALKAILAGGNPRVLGVPVASATSELVQHPEKILDVARGAASGAKKGFLADAPEDQASLTTYLEGVKKDYMRNAIAEAKKQGGDRETTINAAKQIYKDAVQSDLSTIRHSNLAQTAGEFLLDPLNYIPMGKVLGTTAKSAREGLNLAGRLPELVGKEGVKLGDELVKGAYKATETFRHMPIFDPLRTAGTKVGKEISQLGELGEQEGQRVGRIIQRLREGPLSVISKVKDEADKVLLHEVATGVKPVEELPKHLIPAYEASQKLAGAHRALRNVTGLASEFGGNGVLKSPELVTNYVPRRIKKEIESTALQGVDVQPEMRSTLTPASAKSRVAKTGDLFEPDVAKQWDAELKQVEKLGTAAYEIKQTRRALKENGHLIEFETGRRAGKQAQQAEAAVVQSIKDEARATEKANELREQAIKASQDAQVLHTASEGAAKNVTDARKAESLKIQARQLESNAQAMAVQARKLDEAAVTIKGQRQELIGKAAVANKQAETAATSYKQAEEQAAKLTKETGVKWDKLQPGLQKVVSEKTATPLIAHQGDTLTIVPKPIAERFKQLTPVLSKQPNAVDEAVSAYGKFNQAFTRPIQRIWRTSKTLPAPVFHVKNVLGAFGLSTVAHGLQALSPKLQGAALQTALLAAGDGSARAAAQKFLMKNGQSISLGDALKIAHRLGIADQFALKMGQDMAVGGGKLAQLSKAVEHVAEFKGAPVGVQKLSPANIARFAENYQHLAIFLGFLEGTDSKSLAKALAKTSEYAGNYRRLGSVEKTFLREGFSFYSWSRFIFPHILKQIAVNPGRLASYVKIKDAFEREHGKSAPFNGPGIQKGVANLGFTGPPSTQPPWIAEYKKTGKYPPVGSHEFAMLMLEDPMAMGLALVPLLEGQFNSSTPAGRDTIVSQIGPLAQLGMQFMTKKDLDGNLVSEFAHIFPDEGETTQQFLQRAAHSQTGTFLGSFTDRAVSPWTNLYKLYDSDPRSQLDLQLRYKVGRDFMGLDNRVMRGLGKQPRSIGGMFDVGGIPGSTALLQKPYSNAMDQKQRAVDTYKERVKQLNRKTQFDPIIFGR